MQQQQYDFHQHQHFSLIPSSHQPVQTFPHRLPQQQQQHVFHPHPQFLQPHQPPSYPPYSAPHPFNNPFFGPYDPIPPPAHPPSNPEIQKLIDKLVEYDIKNGPEFEAMIREKQHDNPAYSFLFGGEGHGYYRYKLWLSSQVPPAPSFPLASSSLPVMHLSPSTLLNASIGAPGAIPLTPQIHQHPRPNSFDMQGHYQQPQHLASYGPPDSDRSSKPFKGLSGPLPTDVAIELSNVLNNLNGSRDSVKAAKNWFIQRSPFAPALAEALRDRVASLDDSDRQLHIIYLANDILFDRLWKRPNPLELDNEALAFKPVLGSMLARIYQNPCGKDENKLCLQKILEFWASNNIYDQKTIQALEFEMVGLSASSFSSLTCKESLTGTTSDTFLTRTSQQTSFGAQHWTPDMLSAQDMNVPGKQITSAIPSLTGGQQPVPNSMVATFSSSVPMTSVTETTSQPPHTPGNPTVAFGEKLPPYPLFPPGLIPGMVKKMQIGSGVPYSPMSPLDIPTTIPPSTISPSEILQRVSKFFKEIGEVNPCLEAISSSSKGEKSDRDTRIRKGGACIPPPPSLQVDVEAASHAGASLDGRPTLGSSGSSELAVASDISKQNQYEDIYTSYTTNNGSIRTIIT